MSSIATLLPEISGLGFEWPVMDYDRSKGIGGSDAKKIMSGEWNALYRSKKGLAEQEDLSDVFRVQLGTFTEPLNLYWLAKNNPGWKIEQDGVTRTDDIHSHLYCHPDATAKIDGQLAVIDAKHTNPFGEKEQRMKDGYYWQLIHNGYLCGATLGVISPIYGNDIGAPVIIELSPKDTKEYLKRTVLFWSMVECNQEPDDVHAVTETHYTISGLRTVDMTGNNRWADQAAAYINAHEAASPHITAKEDANLELKRLVDADVGEASGHGVRIKRNKKGTPVISTYQEKEQAA